MTPQSSVVSTARRVVIKTLSALRPADSDAMYRSKDVVDFYTSDAPLHVPEQVVLDRLSPWLKGRTMLDIGVGGGRTTPFFAPLTARYVGVDYSVPMVEACRSRFGRSLPSAVFTWADARNLEEFRDGEFDFVLFSWNGIDHLGPEERVRALTEMRRVCSAGGIVCFSSHNLGAAPRLFELRPDERTSLFRYLRGWTEQLVVRTLNPGYKSIPTAPYVVLRESYHEFRSTICYVRPSEALAQLHRIPFSEVELLGTDGRHIPASTADESRDTAIYYIAAKDEQSPFDMVRNN